MNRRPRILLADDHAMLLDAFRRLLEPRCEIVGTAGDGRALMDLAANTRPDVIVLDISMPRLNGMGACVLLRQKISDVSLIFLTVNADPGMAAEAIRLCASGYLQKNSASAELFTTIEQALVGRTYVTPLLTKGVPLGVFLRSHNGSLPTSCRPSVQRWPIAASSRQQFACKKTHNTNRLSVTLSENKSAMKQIPKPRLLSPALRGAGVSERYEGVETDRLRGG